MVDGKAVFEAVCAAGVLGHIPADRADDLAGRVRRVEQAVSFGGLAHREVRDAGFHDGAAAAGVDGDDAAHLGHDNQHAVGTGECTAGQSGAAAAGDERKLAGRAFGDDRRDLLGALRQHYQAGRAAVRGQPVALIRPQLLRVGDDTGGTTDLGHPGGEGDVHDSGIFGVHPPSIPRRAAGRHLAGRGAAISPGSGPPPRRARGRHLAGHGAATSPGTGPLLQPSTRSSTAVSPLICRPSSAASAAVLAPAKRARMSCGSPLRTRSGAAAVPRRV